MARRNMTPGANTNPPQPATPVNTPGSATLPLSTPPPPKANDVPLSAKEILNGLFLMAIGIAISLFVYYVAYLGISNYDIGYLWSAVFAIVMALWTLWAFQKVSGAKSSRIHAPIIMTLAFVFLFTILNGYEKHGSPFQFHDKGSKSYKSETIVFTGVDRWTTRKVFPVGKTYWVTVYGLSTNLLNGVDTIKLEPSVNRYEYIISAEGSPTFIGINHGKGKRSTVTVEWRE